MTTSTHMTQVTASTLKVCLATCLQANRPVMIWGPPGVGKSDIVRQVAAEYSDDEMIDIRAAQLDAVDTRGVPFVADGVTHWAIPSFLPTDPHSRAIQFLDEVTSAPAAVQGALYQLFLDRQLGDYKLPDGVRIIAAGNRESDRAVVNRMSTALADRMFHLELIVDNREWEKWAVANDIHLAVISYLRMRPDHLHLFDAKSPSKSQPTPRGWEFVSDVLKTIESMGVNGAAEFALMTGKLGEAVGSEFVGYLPLYRDCPDPDAIIMAPDKAPLLDNVGINYALCGALAHRATTNNFERIVAYAERMGKASHIGPEFMILMVSDAVIRNPEVQHTQAFVKWAAEHSDIVL